MRMSDCETMNDILNEFAKRDTSGYLVWGQKIDRAYLAEVKDRENESRGANSLTDALNAEVKRLTAEIAKLTADNMRNESLLQKAGETVVALMNKMSAQDEEIKRLRTLVKELADVLDWCNKQADSIGAASLLPVGFPMSSLTMIMAAMSQRCNKIVARATEVCGDDKEQEEMK